MRSRKKPRFRARASLLDRLIDLQPMSGFEARPLRAQSPRKLRESLRRDLEWLLNTRTSVRPERYDSRDLSVIDFGVPDFGAYHTASAPDRDVLVQRMIRAISFFEPRLKDVRLGVEPKADDEKSLRMLIDGVIVVESIRMPVSFLTVFQHKTGTVEIYENR